MGPARRLRGGKEGVRSLTNSAEVLRKRACDKGHLEVRGGIGRIERSGRWAAAAPPTAASSALPHTRPRAPLPACTCGILDAPPTSPLPCVRTRVCLHFPLPSLRARSSRRIFSQLRHPPSQSSSLQPPPCCCCCTLPEGAWRPPAGPHSPSWRARIADGTPRLAARRVARTRRAQPGSAAALRLRRVSLRQHRRDDGHTPRTAASGRGRCRAVAAGDRGAAVVRHYISALAQPRAAGQPHRRAGKRHFAHHAGDRAERK